MVGFGMTKVAASDSKDFSPTYLFKVVLVGNARSGKTAALMKFSQDRFPSEYITTIGVDFAVSTVEINGEGVKLQIWDTAGQERFRTITNSYYRGAQGIALFFDLTDRDSFESIRRWQEETLRFSQPDTSMVIVGTRAEQTEDRVVTDSDIEELKKDLSLEYFEIDSKTGKNIHRLFERIIEKLINVKKSDPAYDVRPIIISPKGKAHKSKGKAKSLSSSSSPQQSKTCVIL